MHPVETSRVDSIIAGDPPPTTLHDSKISQFKNDPLEATDYNNNQNCVRHTRHWRALATLAPCVTSQVQPCLDACRHLVFLFLHRGHVGIARSRQKTSMWGWTESQFEAVFGSLREDDGYQPLPQPPMPAPTYNAAWGGSGVYQSQIVCQVGPKLQDWCSFEDWPQRKGRTHCGCALLASTTLRFLLELTIVFRCNSSRVVGRKTEVTLFMTKATFNSNHELRVQPHTSTKQLPVRAGPYAIEKALSYMCALKDVKESFNEN